MNIFKGGPVLLVRRHEFWIFAGLLVWVTILHTLQVEGASWKNYLGAILVAGLVQSPLFLFLWHKDRLKKELTAKRYQLYRNAGFYVYLPVVMLLCLVFSQVNNTILIFTSAVCSCVLEIILQVNNYYRKKGKNNKWIQYVSLENAVLAIVILISLMLAAMATSSLNDPKYHTSRQLLIGAEFKPRKIIQHFGMFLGFSLQFFFMYLCGYFLFFINSRLLVSKLLKEKGLIVYFFGVLATTAFLYPVMAQLLLLLPINQLLGNIFPANPFQLENAFAALAIMLFSMPVVLVLQWAKQNNQIALLEKERARAELDLLRQQLNPHFFFNTLNNLYALSLQQSKQTPESILQLSELMRYVIYKGQEQRVSIREEVNYIEDYMQLQQIRLKKKLELQFEQEIGEGSPTIAPLLLIVFVENAFKHGIEPAEEGAFLQISLRSDATKLYFSCTNSFEPDIARATPPGIGLENLQKRLLLLYPGKHTLTTAVNNHTFKAELQLDLL